jgi:hypothetical protein
MALAVTCALPLMALRAQQPAAPTQPTAKDVVKAVEKQEAKQEESAKKSNDPIERIKDEGLKHSQVMQTLSYLTDVIGPRLTASPNLKRANEWTRDKLSGWGLQNAHLEPWGPFGRGWSLKHFSAQVVEPQCIPLIAYPKAWSPGTDGPIIGEVVLFKVEKESDFANYQGKLKGAIVLTRGSALNVAPHFEPLATRLDDSALLRLADAPVPTPKKGRRPGAAKGAPERGVAGRGPDPEFERKKTQFFLDEGVAVLIDPSAQGDGGTLFIAAAGLPRPSETSRGPGKRPWEKDAPRIIPQLVIAKEHHNRMVRMIEQGENLKMYVELAVRYLDDDPMCYNTVAEIPGTDLKDELVMLGGHMDSWHSGTGATDNAAGVAVAMEAVRILQTLKLPLRRTVRIALWTGEEQGLLGSRAYVAEHFGKSDANEPGARNRSEDSKQSSPPRIILKSAAEKFSAYYNLDNGTGKIRGVYLQGNEAVRPIFREWLAPFRNMGASTLSITNTGGTDFLSFDAIGLPGFQFIQDPIEYSSRTHHSNMDVYDRAVPDDLKQAAVIMAAFVYHTANRDERLPRKPVAAVK